MKRIRLAIVGFGRLGRACALAAREAQDLAVAGVVRREEHSRTGLPPPFDRLPVASHVGAVEPVDAALVCVPADSALDAARMLLQRGVPIVDCASLDGVALERHHAEIDRIARHHRVPASVGAGWSPGLLERLEAAFALLIPNGTTTVTRRPATALHHSAAARAPGVRGALVTETRTATGTQRYVYVEIDDRVDFGAVEAALRADPLFAGEATQVFRVDRIADLEEAGHGVVLERRGNSGSGAHDTLMLEARFDPERFTARLMLDAARSLSRQVPGAHVHPPTLA